MFSIDHAEAGTYGVEVEFEHLDRDRATLALRRALWGDDPAMPRVRRPGTGHDRREVVDRRERPWAVVRDGSLDYTFGGEVVTPLLVGSEDLALLKQVLEALREAGAQATLSCGLHVHANARRMRAEAICALLLYWWRWEDVYIEALGVRPRRLGGTCTRIPQEVVERFRAGPRDRQQLMRAWYGERCPIKKHYHESRYRTLNLHSVWDHGTAEFRLFNGTLDGDDVERAVLLALAVKVAALQLKGVPAERAPATLEALEQTLAFLDLDEHPLMAPLRERMATRVAIGTTTRPEPAAEIVVGADFAATSSAQVSYPLTALTAEGALTFARALRTNTNAAGEEDDT